MIKVKMCGMKSAGDIEAANKVKPDYIGFVFAKGSRRYISPESAMKLGKMLYSSITVVGVFVNEDIDIVAGLLSDGIIDIAQLHGSENEEYISALRAKTGKPVIKAFRIKTSDDIDAAQKSSADMILLDAGAGDGRLFDHELLKNIARPYFLAGGLDKDNVSRVKLYPYIYALDVSSGIETDGHKDIKKMAEFMDAVRKEEG